MTSALTEKINFSRDFLVQLLASTELIQIAIKEAMNMLTFHDAVMARMRYDEMLKEAAEERRFARYATKVPSIFDRAFAALKGALTPKRTQPAQAQTSAMRKSLATE